ncbi:MAG: DUF411 domain-containing protein [Mariprofundaceae bacterium]|nr:DUF411 domain-containing protein [Mariprofundaceae bacterium]
MKKYIAATLLLLLIPACEGVSETPKSATEHTEVQSQPLATVKQDVHPIVTMYKSPTCDCCGAWAKHLRQSGFVVVENKREDMDAIKRQYGVTEKLASCHTAIVDGYVIEGHVPAEDVKRLLKERPAHVVGLSAPGMPMKSPGMQGVGQQPEGYDVLAFDKEGTSRVFTRY